ncbi:HD domain-containing protein [Actinomadura welshii]
MADHFAEFSMPDTDLTRKAYDHAFALGPAPLAHHGVRVYLFGRAIGETRGVRPGRDYDDELLFLSSVLHDIGLTAPGDGDQRFEVDGADAAAEFLSANGLDGERAGAVWEAIALHTSLGIAHRMRPETALTHAGSAADVVGLGAEVLAADLTARAHAAFPRLDAGCGLTEIMVDQIARNPAKAPMGSLPAEIARQDGADVRTPEWSALVAAAWPGVD